VLIMCQTSNVSFPVLSSFPVLLTLYQYNSAWDTCSAMCFLEAVVPLMDSSSEKCYDVVLVGDPRNFTPYTMFSKSTLFQLYTSVQFTLNPDLYNPRQTTALLAISLVRAITQLLQPKRLGDPLSIQMMLRLLYTLRTRITRDKDDDSYWVQLLGKLSHHQLAMHLTEAPEDDVGSIAKVLALMVCVPNRCSFVEVRECLLLQFAVCSRCTPLGSLSSLHPRACSHGGGCIERGQNRGENVSGPGQSWVAREGVGHHARVVCVPPVTV
jgi:hypothetical protein